MSDQILLVNSASFQDFEISSSLRAGPGIIVNFTAATEVTGTFSGRGSNLTHVSASFIVPDQNTSASYAATSSFAINAIPTVSASWASSSLSSSVATVAAIATSASWVSASNKISNADTASYITSSNIIGIVASASYSITASYSTTSSYSTTASYSTTSSYSTTASYYADFDYSVIFATQSLFATQSTYSTQSINAYSSSWVSASARITTSDTASYISSSAIFDNKTYNITTSFSISSSNVSSASIAISSLQAISSSHSISSSNANSASYSFTSSNSITSSFALTSSYLNDVVYSIQSSSMTHTGDLIAIPSSMSFTMNTGETWICTAHCTAQSNNNRGLRWAISASNSPTFADIEGQIIANTNSITAFTSIRITGTNTVLATSVDTQANVAGSSNFNFILINPSATTTISIAFAVTNTGDTATVIAGSYLKAERVR